MTIVRRPSTTFFFAIAMALSASWVRHGRADAPPGRYTIANGTVHDTKTGLTWQQTISPMSYSWTAAQTYCNTLSLDSGSWRVPSMKELQTIVDESRSLPAIDANAFPMDMSGFPSEVSLRFWTSSQRVGLANRYWYVSFSLGDVNYANRIEGYHVRCVR